MGKKAESKEEKKDIQSESSEDKKEIEEEKKPLTDEEIRNQELKQNQMKEMIENLQKMMKDPKGQEKLKEMAPMYSGINAEYMGAISFSFSWPLGSFIIF
eukprot:TRINITY_DN10563_c0_g1_i1.p1 TRINITY_DN10563_c0_g1~~TRINITY_DN10563_c0_g1_i1.p1  ORF type:complete len:100 (+),score=44.75 TRINITY_DN10563_c0_g1_i1:154-453(+)